MIPILISIEISVCLLFRYSASLNPDARRIVRELVSAVLRCLEWMGMMEAPVADRPECGASGEWHE